MGHGCYFTHDCNKSLAPFIDLSLIPESDIYLKNYIYDNISYILINIGYTQNSMTEFENGLFKVNLKEYGHCIPIFINPVCNQYNYNTWKAEFNPKYNLAIANHHRAEDKIIRALKKGGYRLYIGTSGYTAKEI